jgi:DNA processing protein
VLVVEANARSGSLITARFAAEQNREVFALPGSIHSSLSKGCHKLIKDGAKLTECVADILGELGLETVEVSGVARSSPSHPLLAAMGFDPVCLDQMAERTGMTVAAIAAQLSLFEIDGTISALPGGRFQRAAGVA